ncbi:MAG: ScpA family protein [Pseudomonadota bacterium]
MSATESNAPEPSTHDADGAPVQAQIPLAVVRGERIMELPRDLYIPPDALEVFLEAFEGPLDLLLYLIRKQNLDILDIPITVITRQYMAYIEMMDTLRLELAAEYLVMAAMLAEIKSRMLLPRPEEIEEEDDPRAELIRRLQQYEQIKSAAVRIDDMPRLERDLFVASAELPELRRRKPEPDVDIKQLLLALNDVFTRADQLANHHISREALSVREKMTHILGELRSDEFTAFADLFQPEEGRLGVVVNFLAILELIKESLIDIQQTAVFAPIYLRARGSLDPGPSDDGDDDGDGDGDHDPSFDRDPVDTAEPEPLAEVG